MLKNTLQYYVLILLPVAALIYLSKPGMKRALTSMRDWVQKKIVIGSTLNRIFDAKRVTNGN